MDETKKLLTVAALSAAVGAGSVYYMTDKGEYQPVEVVVAEVQPHERLVDFATEPCRAAVEGLGEARPDCKRCETVLGIRGKLTQGWCCGEHGAWMGPSEQSCLDAALVESQKPRPEPKPEPEPISEEPIEGDLEPIGGESIKEK